MKGSIESLVAIRKQNARFVRRVNFEAESRREGWKLDEAGCNANAIGGVAFFKGRLCAKNTVMDSFHL